MTAITAQEYYAIRAAEEQEYLPVARARKVRAGEKVTVNSVLGIDAQVIAPEDGYEVRGPERRARFLTPGEFAEKTVSAEGLDLPAARDDFSDEELKGVTPVRKGEKIYVNPGLPILAVAEEDGFVVADSRGYSFFMSNYKLTALFNYAGQKYSTHEAPALVSYKDEERIRGIILTEEVTFAFKSGDYTAAAGSLLFVNPDDEDGYTLLENANISYRVAPRKSLPRAPQVKTGRYTAE